MNEEIHYLVGREQLKIVQSKESFSFSLDSVLLPNFVTIRKNTKRILDICTGTAPIPLILSRKTKASIIGVEIQKNIADLAEESVKINGLDDQIKIINADIKSYQTEEKFDLITCNPPYFKVTSLKNLNENQAKSIARHEITIDLETIIKISSKLLNDQGIFGLVHRPSRLIEIVNLCEKYSLEIKKIQFVYPRINEEANIVVKTLAMSYDRLLTKDLQVQTYFLPAGANSYGEYKEKLQGRYFYEKLEDSVWGL